MGLGVQPRGTPLGFIRAFFSFTTAVLSISSVAFAALDPDAKEIQKMFDQGTKDPVVYRFVRRHLNEKLKHKMDFAIDQTIENDAILLKEVMPQVYAYVANQTLATALDLSWKLPKARKAKDGDPGLYERELKLLQQVARELFIPREVRNNATVSIVPADHVINAATYSDFRSLNMILYRGLILKTSKRQLKSVFGHEVGHMFGEHVPHQLAIIAVFLATGESILPELKKEDGEELEKEIKKEARKMLGQQHKCYQACSLEYIALHEKVLESHFAFASDLAQKLRTKFSKETLSRLARSFGSALLSKSHEHDSESADGSDELKTQNGKVITKEEILKFLAKLEAYSRACETSADRFGLYVTDAESSAAVDLILTTGSAEHMQAMRKQLEEVHAVMVNHPELADQMIKEQGSHPAGLARLLQYEMLENSLGNKVFSDPFLKALDLYVATARRGEELENLESEVSDNFELMTAIQHKAEEAALAKFEDALLEKLVSIILQDFAAESPARVDRFSAMMGYFHSGAGNPVPFRVVQNGGLLRRLHAGLETLGEKIELAKKAAEAIKTTIGVSNTLARDSSTLPKVKAKNCSKFLKEDPKA